MALLLPRMVSPMQHKATPALLGRRLPNRRRQGWGRQFHRPLALGLLWLAYHRVAPVWALVRQDLSMARTYPNEQHVHVVME